jgi:sporulation-control protein
VFKRMLSAFGVGGPSVDTVLDSAVARPGEVIAGRVRIQGGTSDTVIDQVVLSLVTRIEVETSGGEAHGVGEFHRLVVATDVRVPTNELLDIPFQLSVPWETPITAVGEVALPGVTVGVRTELVITGALDKGDLDPLSVRPTAAQDRVLDAFGELGATFRATDVEAGRIAGVSQELGFYQEIEFYPPAAFAGRLNEVELTFVTGHRDLWVVLEAGKRGGLLRQSGDTFGRFHMTHEDAERADWSTLVGDWLTKAADRAPAFGGHGHHGPRGRRGGMGGVVGGAVAGLAGGMLMADMMDGELFDGGDLGAEE